MTPFDEFRIIKSPEYQTRTIVALAKELLRLWDDDFNMPRVWRTDRVAEVKLALADALQDAGIDDPVVLSVVDSHGYGVCRAITDPNWGNYK